MSKNVTLLLILILITLSIITFVPVKAEAKTIIVPDDYSSIQDAVNSAIDEDTIFVKKGTYEAPLNQTLTIDKAISLIGEDPEKTIINLHPPLVPMSIFTYSFMGYSDALKIEADNVKLSGLTIRSNRPVTVSGSGGISLAGEGIQITGSIINTSIIGFGNRTQIIKNMVESINLQGFNQIVLQNTLRGGIGEGEFLLSCTGANNTIVANKMSGEIGGICVKGSNNFVGGNSITNTSGINGALVINGDKNIIAKNDATNVTNGVSIGGSSNVFYGNKVVSNLVIVGNDNIFYANYLQGLVLGNRINDASNNTFYHNYFDFVVNDALTEGEKTFTIWEGVKGTNFLDNDKEGNYWSDYKGYDFTFDGIGDTPYVIDAKDPLNYHNIADFNIANVTLTDHYPLISPFNINSVRVDLPEWVTDSSIMEELPDFSLPEYPTPFPTAWIIIVAASVGATITAVLVYFVKVKKSRLSKGKSRLSSVVSSGHR